MSIADNQLTPTGLWAVSVFLVYSSVGARAASGDTSTKQVNSFGNLSINSIAVSGEYIELVSSPYLWWRLPGPKCIMVGQGRSDDGQDAWSQNIDTNNPKTHTPVNPTTKASRGWRILAIIAWTWVVLGMASFLAHALIHEIGAPKWLPLPWSHVWDFAESADGKVYVSLAMLRRVVCYDEQGRFLASYRSPFRAHLASDLRGRIFCKGIGSTYSLWICDSSWNLLAEHSKRYEDGTDWRLDENGELVPEPSRRSGPVVDRAAKSGEYIFSKQMHRKSFTCMDGSRLVKKWNYLDRYSEDGRLVARYSGPWFFSPFTFPWPGFSAWLVAALCCYIR